MMADVLKIIFVGWLVGHIAAFLILLATKLGIIEYMQTHGGQFVSELASCDFCKSWWASVIIALPLAFAFTEPWLVIVPVVSTIISRKSL